jgi:hypothetical protein
VHRHFEVRAAGGQDRFAEIMSSPQRFRIAIHRAKGCYFARVIDLPGCVARGASEVEAVENARAAIRAFQWVAQVLAGDDPTIQLEISA